MIVDAEAIEILSVNEEKGSPHAEMMKDEELMFRDISCIGTLEETYPQEISQGDYDCWELFGSAGSISVSQLDVLRRTATLRGESVR